MISLATAYILAFGISGAACAVGILGVRSLEHPDVRWGLGGMLALSAAWAWFTALKLLMPTLSGKEIVYMGSLTVGIGTVFAWVYFASAYSGRQYHRHRILRWLGVSLFVGVILVKLTNPLHGMYFSATLVTDPFRHAQLVHYAPHWFVTGFSYTAAGWGFWLLFESFESGDSRPILLYVLVAITALPLIPYGVSPFSDLILQINYEPIGVAIFALGVLFYARGEFTRYSTPGQSDIVDSIDEGALVIDDHDEVINYNDNVARLLGDRPNFRSSLADYDSDLATLEDGDTTVIRRTVDGRERTVEAERVDIQGPMASAAITLTDVSTTAHLEEVTRLYRELNEALIEGTDPAALEATIPETLADIEAYRFVRLVRPDAEYVGGDPADYPAAVDDDPAEPVTRAMETGNRQLVTVADTEGPWAQAATMREITGCLAEPISFPDGTRGVLGLYTTMPAGFREPEVTLVSDIAESIPHALSAIRAHVEATEYQKAVEHAGYAIYVTDADGTIRHVNPAFEEITGYTREEAIGTTPAILSSGEMDDAYYEDLWETISSGEVFEEEIINKRKSGDRYLARQTIAPVTDGTGDPIAYVAVQIDVTDQLVREQRLTVLNRILRHNLRNEMNLISGAANLIEDFISTLPEDIEGLMTASESVADIQELTDTIVARSEKARNIEKTLERLRGTTERVQVQDVLVPVQHKVANADGAGDVAASGEVTERYVDREVMTIIEELVDNAIEHGGDTVSQITVTATERDGEVHFQVQDDGPGLSEQELAIVEEGTETQLRHGSGLGLWMVSWLTVSAGGDIETTVEDGTTFDLRVPTRSPPS